MIYTVTLNPSVDYSMTLPELSVGEVNRSNSESHTYGGKGINVSAMLGNLGVENTALGFIGGFAGREIERLSIRAGIRCDFCEIHDNSRINVKILADRETAVNGNGPFIRLEEEKLLLEKLSALSDNDTVVVSGSSPESESRELLRNVLSAAAHTRLIADMEGELLSVALEKRPFLIKPNEEELCAFFGKDSMEENEIVASARMLMSQGAQNVIVSRGGLGALLVADDGNVYKIRAPRINVKSTVGAGDSFLAGFIAGYENGVQFALALGAAAGSATAACTGIADGAEVMNVFAAMQ